MEFTKEELRLIMSALTTHSIKYEDDIKKYNYKGDVKRHAETKIEKCDELAEKIDKLIKEVM